MTESHIPVRRALVSCFDKTGVAEFAQALAAHGVEIVSTGSTAAHIADAGVAVTEVAEITGFPECLDGRVKTLHPHVHAGILADRRRESHRAQLDELGVEPIDLVVVNLYPFVDTVAATDNEADIIEMIDIGGPTMVRAAAKNHALVGVVVEPDDYARVLGELEQHGGLGDALRRDLATAAFRHTAAYDAAVATWFQRDEEFPTQLSVTLTRSAQLRYGENPHQAGAFYVSEPRVGLAAATQHHGKELSYNNLLDTDAAWGMAIDQEQPCVAIIKHTNPAGYAVADSLRAAYDRALAGDPVSAFGGIVAANRAIDDDTAAAIIEVFTEVVIAPGYTPGALETLQTRKNVRILEMSNAQPEHGRRQIRSISGGLLVQDADTTPEPWDDWQVVTDAALDDDVMRDLRFAWIACKHTKSNAIVLVRDQQVVGVGAGQMSRVDSVRLAVQRSGERHLGAVLASDAFFPFRDGPDAAAAAGITAIVQPGGSVRDDEVIAAANEHGIAMVFTGRRHFRH